MTNPSHFVLRRSQPGFPARLAAAVGAADTLYGLGDVAALEAERVVGVVGARAASAAGLARARALATGLVQGGVVVVSGGAVGIDAAAHAGALEVGGRTMAVVAGGVATPYPPRNRWLFDEMVRAGGAVVSHFGDDAPVRSWSFLHRNQTLAALVDALIIVEARPRSGSLSTARAALRFGRMVLAVPGSPGTDALLAQGAGLVEESSDVFEALAGRPRSPAPEAPAGAAARVWSALDGIEPRDAVILSKRVGMAERDVARALVALELDGLAFPVPGGSYVRGL